MGKLIRSVTSLIAVHLFLCGFAPAAGDVIPYSLKRKAGIDQAEKIVLQHIPSHRVPVQFRKVGYFEHHSIVHGRRILTAIAVCGQLKLPMEQGAGYQRFLAWLFMDLETGNFNNGKYVVATHNGGSPAYNLYQHYHSAICANSEDGMALEASINLSKYE